MLNAQGQMSKVDADSDRQIVVSEHACTCINMTGLCAKLPGCGEGSPWWFLSNATDQSIGC